MLHSCTPYRGFFFFYPYVLPISHWSVETKGLCNKRVAYRFWTRRRQRKMAYCKRIKEVWDRFYFCFIVIFRFAILTPYKQFRDRDQQKRLWIAQDRNIDPKSYLTVNAHLQILQILSAILLKYMFLARILDRKLCTRMLLGNCSHVVFVTSRVENKIWGFHYNAPNYGLVYNLIKR